MALVGGSDAESGEVVLVIQRVADARLDCGAFVMAQARAKARGAFFEPASDAVQAVHQLDSSFASEVGEVLDKPFSPLFRGHLDGAVRSLEGVGAARSGP